MSRQVVFNSGQSIKVSSETGDSLRTIATTMANNTRPEWSPDGTRIAYEDRGDIWLMNADGSDKHMLYDRQSQAANSDPIYNMTWAPDGTIITSEFGYSYNGGGSLLKIRMDGSATEVVQSGYYSKLLNPEVSRNGDIAYFSKNDHILHISNSDGSNVRNIATVNTYSDYKWSPDGNWLAYTNSDNALCIVKSDGTNGRIITTDTTYTFCWSPDGGRIALQGCDSSGRNIDQLVNVDGTGLTQLNQVGGYPLSNFQFTSDGQNLIGRYDLNIGVLNISSKTVSLLDPSSGGFYNMQLNSDISPVGGTGLTDYYVYTPSSIGSPLFVGGSTGQILDLSVNQQLRAQSVENIAGSTGNDSLFGNSGVNHLWGNSGDDILYGAGGNDIYYWGRNDGNDTLVASAFDDGSKMMFYNVNSSDIYSTRVGNDALFRINGNTTDSLTIKGWYDPMYETTRIHHGGFADGSTF